MTLIMALISTVLKIISDFLQVASDYIGPKYEEGKDKASAYVNEAEKKLGEYQKIGEQKTEQVKSEAAKTKDDASKKMQK